MTELEKYADRSMYEAAPMASKEATVKLLSMNPDPLGSIAAACRMYEGVPTYSLADITDKEREKYLADVQKTHLQAPLEFVKLHFFIEGVPRSFTHQLVRQRTAVYAQESLRFAVKDNFADESYVPPSIRQASRDIQEAWHDHNARTQDLYSYLVANGIPAEDAREQLPHCTTTRVNYATDLRNLIGHAGNRLCTQAQFIWRQVFKEIVVSIAGYGLSADVRPENRWQFQALVEANMFKPVCYAQGRCPFQASFDRGCTIRERVEAFHSHGVASDVWHLGSEKDGIAPIRTAEWMDDERAAWQ